MKTTSAPTGPVASAERSGASGHRSWWFALGLVLVGIPVIYWTQANPEPKELAVRREQIKNMSPTERDRLERNYERFQKLSPEEQNDLREINETVQNDDDLESTLQTYDRWLHTLTPWQRQELRNTKTPSAKLEVVASINTDRRRLLEEYQEQDREWQDLVRRYLPSGKDRPRREEKKRLSGEDLDIMFSSVLKEDFGKRVKLGRNALPGNAAYNFELLAQALEANIESLGLEKAKESPLSDEMIQNMIATIGDSEIREDTEKEYEKDGPRGFVLDLLVKLHFAWWNEARYHYPKQSELEELARILGGEALTKFEETKKHDRRRAYMQLLFATRPATYRHDSEHLYKVLGKLEIRKPFWLPGAGGPGSGRFGKGRGDRDHGDGRGRDHRDHDGRGGNDSGDKPSFSRDDDRRDSSNDKDNASDDRDCEDCDE